MGQRQWARGARAARWALGLSAVWMAGCAASRMVPPGDVAKSSDVLQVQDRSSMSGALADESFKLGEYSVTDVDRDWDSSSGSSFGGFGDKTKTTGYQFKLKGGKEDLSGQCASETKEKSVFAGGGAVSWGSVRISCACHGSGEGAEIVLAKAGNKMTFDGKTYKVSPVNTTEDGESSDPSGFRVDGDGPLGAVEVVHPGQVWLEKGLEEPVRSHAACLFAGLMLYKPPSDN
jgi:hypothetical protein